MFRKGRTLAVALALAALLVGSFPAAAVSGGRGRAPQSISQLAGGFLDWAWHLVTAGSAKSGACIDPNGQCAASTATTGGSDKGACIDPNGAPCAAPSENDRGMSIDPNG